MTIELEKTTKCNGDIFYTILSNGTPNLYSRMYGGNNIEDAQDKLDAYETKAFTLLEDYKRSRGKDIKEIIYSETLNNNNAE